MAGHPATHAVLMTPAGRGAVATVLVEGPRATDIVAELFQPAGRPLSSQPLDRIVLGRWQSPEGEELIICRREIQRIEIHCHGGEAASRAILDSLRLRGCREIDWQDWLAQLEQDAIVAEALIALAAARTQRTATVLLDQYRGALRQAVDEIDRKLALRENVAALAAVGRLLANAPLGRHLVEPWRVVLAGPPNVGKSSLINALVGYNRAIVYDRPGTTRDVITATVAFDGWPVELADTAGLRASDDPLEAAGVQLAQDQLSAAHLIVLVFDLGCCWSAADSALVDQWPEALLVHNKCDLAGAAGASRPGGLRTSALTRQGLDELEGEISRRLVPNAPPAGQAVPFTDAQSETLRQVQAMAELGNSAAARRLLSSGPFSRSTLI